MPTIVIYKKDELTHHGILGMKWGKRNGPPYPLSPSDHSASEKKAGWKKSLGGGRNESEYGKRQLLSKDDVSRSVSKLKKKQARKQKAVDRVQKDIDSFKGHENGIYDNKGRLLLSKEDVTKSVAALEKKKAKRQEKVDRIQKDIDSFKGHEDGIYYEKNNNRAKMDIKDTDSSETKKVKKDYNELSEEEFLNKYKVSKKKYERRVKAYGDPAARSPLSKIGRGRKAIDDVLTRYGTRKVRKTEEAAKKEKAKQARQNDISDIIPGYKKKSNSPNSLYDIDDVELIDLYIDDPDFRKEYGVSDADYKKYKQNR